VTLILAVIAAFRSDPGFLSVQACKPAWNGHKWAFLYPCGKSLRTLAKSARNADEMGTCTLARLETLNPGGK
jgi:hypothetical protein